MFKSFNGFHLVEAYLKIRHEKRNQQPGRVLKKSAEAIMVVLVTLLLWNLPSESFGIEGLNVVQQATSLQASSRLVCVRDSESPWRW